MWKRPWVVVITAVLSLLLAACQGEGSHTVEALEVPENAVARIVFFQAGDCEPCVQVYDELIVPLQGRCGDSLEVKSVDVTASEGYEIFAATERAMIGEAGRWEVPVVVVEDTYLIGERAINQELLPHMQCVFGSGGNAWPDVPALTAVAMAPTPGASIENPFGAGNGEGIKSCVEEEDAAVCASPDPIFALYLAPENCNDTCDRTRYDLRYLQGVYPQLSFEERSIEENRELAEALVSHLGVDLQGAPLAPAAAIGETYLAGDELNLDSLRSTLEAYADTGAMAVWYTLDVE
ncbi:MAG: hypothetical protein ACP5JG_16245, partial [Anaerolineae bacterium]